MVAPARRSSDTLELEQRRQREAQLILQGMTQRDVAKEVGVTVSVVNADLNQHILPQWRAQAAADVGERVMLELAKLDELERTYWEAWKRSLTTFEKRTSTRTDRSRMVMPPASVQQAMLAMNQAVAPNNLTSTDERATLVREEREGNPLFLQGVAWCIDRRIKLLGADTPKQVDIEGHIRAAALAMGLDPDQAVEEAQRVMAEVKQVPNLIEQRR